jgi:endonuclease/exonuclease/phosphatase family metal-dependent hydrolase
MSKYLSDSDVDVIAMQELGSGASARTFLSSSYRVFVEPREFDISRRSDRDIFTAVAVRRRSDLNASAPKEIAGLSLKVVDGDTVEFTRAGLAVETVVNSTGMTVVSVHMKAGCYERLSFTSQDCLLLQRQFEVLRDWIVATVSQGKSNIVVAGDWNRNFVRLGPRDELLKNLLKALEERNVPTRIVSAPEGSCSVRKNIYDYFLFIGNVIDMVVGHSVTTFSPSAYELGLGINPGDHCLVTVDLLVP